MRWAVPGWFRRPSRGSAGVAAVFVAAGFLFATSAQTARGTQLRPERLDVTGLIESETARNRDRAEQLAEIEREIAAETSGGDVSAETDRLNRARQPLEVPAGIRAVHGPALTVTLDDAPRDKPVPEGVGPDDLVVHQQDVQAVVNALWAGGAEAMMLQDQRVISTSAVRCVGNTLILQGRVYSPPYTVTAIGDVSEMREQLDASPGVSIYQQYVAALNLGWEVEERADAKLPAYDGPLTLAHARVPGAGPTAGASVSSSP